MTRWAGTAARAALVVALAAAIPPVHERVEARSRPAHEREVLYLWSGRHVRLLFPGFRNLAADLYWLRSVQYYGGRRRFSTDKSFPLLRPLVEITTDLDPRFEIAYRYGAVFLAEPRPVGAGDAQAAIELLEKGIRHMPSDWRLRQWLGFFHYAYRDDAESAARVLQEGADQPGAPYWLRTMAATFLASGGRRDLSRQLWRQIYDQSEEGALRENARGHLRHLDALDNVDVLNRLVERFAREHGRRPRTLDEIRQAGLWPAAPVDPAGVPFGYDPETGVVEISRASPLWRPRPAT